MEQIENDIASYLLDDEAVTYSFSHRPTGLLNWIKSLVGYGKTHWYVTDERLLVYRRVAGGFQFREVPLENVTSVEYGRKIDTQLLTLGLITVPILVGVLIVLYALFRKQQVLEMSVSGGTDLSVVLSRGEEIDEFLWYLPAQRKLTQLAADR